MGALEAAGHFFLAGNLASLGMHTSIWTTARKLDAEDNLYRFAGLASHEWFDDRLLRICKVRLCASHLHIVMIVTVSVEMFLTTRSHRA